MKQFILLKIEERRSKMNGGEYFRLTWVDTETLQMYETDVQDTYRNFIKNGWRHIVTTKQYGLYTNLLTRSSQSKQGMQVITADSYPQLLTIASQKECFEIAERLIDQKAPAPDLGPLFEVE